MDNYLSRTTSNIPTPLLFERIQTGVDELNLVLRMAGALYWFDVFPGEHSLRIVKMAVSGTDRQIAVREEQEIAFIDDPGPGKNGTSNYMVKCGHSASPNRDSLQVLARLQDCMVDAFDKGTAEELRHRKTDEDLSPFAQAVLGAFADDPVIRLEETVEERLRSLNAAMAGAGLDFRLHQIALRDAVIVYQVNDGFDLPVLADIRPLGNSGHYQFQEKRDANGVRIFPLLSTGLYDVGNWVEQRLRMIVSDDVWTRIRDAGPAAIPATPPYPYLPFGL